MGNLDDLDLGEETSWSEWWNLLDWGFGPGEAMIGACWLLCCSAS